MIELLHHAAIKEQTNALENIHRTLRLLVIGLLVVIGELLWIIVAH